MAGYVDEMDASWVCKPRGSRFCVERYYALECLVSCVKHLGNLTPVFAMVRSEWDCLLEPGMGVEPM